MFHTLFLTEEYEIADPLTMSSLPKSQLYGYIPPRYAVCMSVYVARTIRMFQLAD